MKKLMYFATALLVLAGCNKKENALNNTPDGTPFKKGQQVTLTIGTGDNNQAAPRRVAGTDNGDRIAFAWEAGDQILVKVDDKTAVFTLSSEPGSVEGEFTGEMPAAGSTFDIQYPIVAPDLSAQVYTTTKTIPADKMLFTATNCTLNADAFLNAQYAMVQLNLYGTKKTVGKIVFKNMTAKPTVSYTLTCTGGKTIGATSTTATPFYMVVPAGKYKFEVEVCDAAATPAKICSFATSATKTFVAGECLNMPAKEVADPYNGHAYVDLGLPSGLKWATMNVGATKPEGYGDYFAWGETETYYTGLNTDGSAKGWKTGKDTGYKWKSYCGKSSFTEWSPVPYDANRNLLLTKDVAAVKWGGVWRMPTEAELTELLNNCTSTWTTQNGVSGYKFTSKKSGYTSKSIFLPAAGYFPDASFYYAGQLGKYWSSTVASGNSYYARYVNFNSGSVYVDSDGRYLGFPVRPVCK